MRLLITGGAGTLGANIVSHYSTNCESIVVIDNFVTGKRESIFPADNIIVVDGSITDLELVRSVFQEEKPTHVIHAAASYKDPLDWATDAMVNVSGTINVLRASETSGVHRFVNLQTALCYGRPSTSPIPVDHPCSPFTSYGISKTAGEQYVANSTLSWTSLRLANVTSPHLSIGPIPAFYKRLRAGQSCSVSQTIRDFLDITDFLGALDMVMTSDRTGMFNISTGIGHTIEEIYQLVAKHLHLEDSDPPALIPPAADDVPSVVLDPSETERAFGWCARVDFEDSVRKMLAWYDENGIDQVFSHLKNTESR